MRCWEEAYRFGAFGPGFMVWTAGASEIDKMAPYVAALRLAAFLGEPSAEALYKGLVGPQ